MSSEKDQDHRNLVERVLALKQAAEAHRHRRLLVLQGDAPWCRQAAARLSEALPGDETLWVGSPAPAGLASVHNRQALERLGGEVDLLVYDAFAGFDPDAFGALSGTLRGGGLLLLLTPPLAQWGNFADPEYQRIAVAGYPVESIEGNFLRRLAKILQIDPRALLVEAGKLPPVMPQADVPTPPLPQPDFGDCRSADQLRAVEAILHVAQGHRHRPLVLSADRGRGKSAALGIAAARLLRGGARRILVTGPRREASDSLFEQAGRLLPGAQSHGTGLQLDEAALRYSAPDHLLAAPQGADLLLVDEAAAIPTPLLEGLLAAYPRIVFATTVHGYEGTGRGFALRFKAHLDRQTPQWQLLQLHEPIRWAAHDPLEALVFRLLALDASPAPDESVMAATPNNVNLQQHSPAQLLAHEEELQQLFGLLVLAHYRTTPLDLQHLLDGPNLRILLLRQGDAVVGVALLALEGGFDETLAAQIWAGYRRPRGHLLAQSLAAHLGLRSAPALKGLRIMRIAIHPAVQRRGLGRRLLEEIRAFGLREGFDYLGTSFGANEALIEFWRVSGFSPVRLGLKSGASSGGHSVMLMQPLSTAGREMATLATQAFNRQLPALLGDPLRDLSPALAVGLFHTISHPPPIVIEPEAWYELAGFAFARRGYETALPAIRKLSLLGLFEGALAPAEAGLLVMRVLQGRPWTECARLSGLSGRRETEQRLREILARLVIRHGDPAVIQWVESLNPPA